jgi:hypothetical protein
MLHPLNIYELRVFIYGNRIIARSKAVKRVLISMAVMLVLVAGVAMVLFRSPAPPATPIAMSTPPDVETGFHAVNVVSRDFDVEVSAFRRWMDQGQMVKALQSTESIAKPAEIVYLSGSWPAVGAVRRVKLEDGHYVLERVLASEFPGLFRYQVWGFTNSAGNLVKYATGEFRYTSIGPNRTQFTWTYSLRPKSALLRPVLNNFVHNQFAPFMQGGITGLSPPTNPSSKEEANGRN